MFRSIFLYFCLGLISSFLSSLLLAAMIWSHIFSLVLCALLIFISIIIVIITIFKSKTCSGHFTYCLTAFFSLIGGILCSLLKSDYHIKANYLNRASVYFFIVGGLSLDISLIWSLLTRLFIKAVLFEAIINKDQENLLYASISLANALITALVIPAAGGESLKDISIDTIFYTFGVWIMGGVIAATCGIAIENKTKIRAKREGKVIATSKMSGYDEI